jgi:hypothetical protein
MHIAPACAGSRKGSNHFESYVQQHLNYKKLQMEKVVPL